ncbi:carboxypeptidase B-like isoform X3 [Orbicella faveolata]|uniref:carboxypeptidase B-like isoform X2 n=1 Tax=Orbicella faveolata TaxID=48498 RepID=UPI0009E313E4|nr:carboxypeptidase B-like isoform X2 [Orbicella faveolata]XP_020615345.1 carboxypeptidase B-like isoform X3 [Orbicella faveolata]
MNWGLPLLILTLLQALLVQSDKVIRVTPEVEAHLAFLRGLEKRSDIKIDFWKEPSHLFQAVDIGVSEEDFITLSSLLEADGIEYKVQIDDVQKLIEGELQTVGARGFSQSWHNQYHDLDEIRLKLIQVQSSYEHMTETITLGRSHENREMTAIKIRGKSSYNKPVFFIECGIHAREWVSPATCMFIIDEMTQKYGKDSSVTALLDKMDFIILPVLNVDGYAYTWIDPRWSKYRLWRKNRRKHDRYGCHGVDLNRNWGYGWGGAGASTYPCDTTYRGSTKFSEVETVNVRNFLSDLNSEGKLKGFIDFHAYSQMWFIPWGYTSLRTNDYNEQMRVAKEAAMAVERKHGTKFQYGSSAALLYPAAGGSEDWTYGELGVKYSFSVELRDTGRYGFLLPPDQIIPTGEETFEGLKALVKAMERAAGERSPCW